MKRMAAVGLMVVLTVLLVSLSSGSAQAGTTSGELKFEYWPAYIVAMQGNYQFASWYTTMLGLQLRLRIPNTPLSWHLEYLGGFQSDGAGNWTNSHGSDKLVRSYISYPFLMTDRYKIAGALGWGKVGWDTEFWYGGREGFRSAGVLVGLYAEWTVKHNLDLYSKVTFQPMNTVSIYSNGNTWTSNGTMTDFQAGLRYKPSFGIVEFGYRKVAAFAGDNYGCPDCMFRWSGWFLKFGIPLGGPTLAQAK